LSSGISIASLLQRFRAYSLEIKHIEEGTVASEISHVRGFLEHAFAHNPQGFVDGLTAEDRCIILCFTELALRCSEVAALALDDFNWHGRYVTVRNTKNGSDRKLPLSAKLWDALVEYLTQARPQTVCRTLFVRFGHSRGEAMGGSQIRAVIRRNGAKAGLGDRDSGTHILRRTAATKLYNSGNSLKLTADILGHESLNSTTHYAKTDISGLLSVASPWPGGDCNVG